MLIHANANDIMLMKMISAQYVSNNGKEYQGGQRTRSNVAVHSQIELEFGNVGVWGEGKTGVPGEKPLGAEYRTNNKLNPHMTPGPGMEPGTQKLSKN